MVIILNFDNELLTKDAFVLAEDHCRLAFHLYYLLIWDLERDHSVILARYVDQEEVVEGHPLSADEVEAELQHGALTIYVELLLQSTHPSE